jgi:four helix bundle protein
MSELGQFKEEMKKRTKLFAHRCVKLALSLPQDQLGNQIRGQLIRAATSVAANYRASCNALSIPVIITKMSISIEEADESEFWIEFALDENLTESTGADPLIKEAHEIASILIKARQTLQNKNK